jgi:N-methylhydantoinase A
MTQQFRVAVDIGGTFTDVVAFEESTGTFRSGKSPTTPGDLVEGVLAAIGTVLDDPTEVVSIVHGTTVGLNALLTRRGERVALLATRGVRDSYHIARGHRLDIFNIHHKKVEPLVLRSDVLEIGGRLNYRGDELEPLSLEDVALAADHVRAEGITSVAVCLLFSYLNPEHEQTVAKELERLLPDVTISVSHQMAREWREYERTSTTVLNAYSGPTVRRYLTDLEAGLRKAGVKAPLLVMQSNGGIIGAERAREQPLQTFFSGPVGGTAGGVALAARSGRRNLICVDMGGTSFDMSLVVDGRAEELPHAEMETFPALMPVVDIQTVGAGGGSLASVAQGGLRVGPESAGAVPGPACYDRGGTQPTVTDANLVLGRIDPGRFLGGRMPLDPELAHRALGTVAAELGLAELTLAEGVIDVINAKMSQAIRAITVERGIEPRDFALVAFGGAGALHAAALAEDLGIEAVVVPAMPGAFSAWGMLQSPFRQDFSVTCFARLADLDGTALDTRFSAMEDEAVQAMEDGGADPDAVVFERSLDLRYVGQEYTITVVLPMSAMLDDATAIVAEAFHAEYLRRYGHSSPESPVETVNLRVVARVPVDITAIASEPAPPPLDRSVDRLEVVFDRTAHETLRLNRADLAVGESLDGPLIVDEPTSTTIVPPGWNVAVDVFHSMVLTRTENARG